ncbi:hypothetical protein C2G38_2110341 [Gigaspora rosea]|uniref:Uncharacterized protein n=1 Tax=Gigaspora rosea TaxID=44941 RepID=A0A397UI43_9GLOM|nr:hypothetical protein C2G38_2110341 [Gigaspora rosea]
MMADNGEKDDDDDDIETDPEMEMTMVEHPPSSFGNLKRTKSFNKYKIGDDVLKFEESGWGNVFRSYSIGKNGHHNYGGKHKLDKSGGDNNASSAIHSAINSVKSFKSFISLNRFLESQQNDKNGSEIKQNGGNEYTNDDNTVEKENKVTINLTNNDQMVSDTLPPTPPPPAIPLMHLKTPGSMRN